jgi:hypothetical protein
MSSLKTGSGKSFPPWNATLDELADEDGWLLELHSSELYLTLKVSDRSIVERAEIILNTALTPRMEEKPTYYPETDELVLGHFGDATVSLRRDNEDFSRCFLVVATGKDCCMFFNLYADSIKNLAEALHNI